MTALKGFEIDSLAKILGGLDGSGVSRGIRIADWEALLVKLALGEDASQLDFPRMCRLTLYFALAACSFLLDHRHDSFRGALHRLGGYFQISQQFHLFAAVIEGSILPHQSLHAPVRERTQLEGCLRTAAPARSLLRRR